MTQIILGGGISGLSAAHYLRKSNPASKIIVLEAANRFGGWINTSLQPNGVLFETGPHAIRVKGEKGTNTLVLAEDLGLADKIFPIKRDHPAANKRMIQVDGKLHLLPTSLNDVFKKMPPFKSRFVVGILKDLFTKKATCTDESAYSFVNRRFGSQFANYIMDPIAIGVFAGNSKKLSIKALANNLHLAEQTCGSVIKGVFKLSKMYLPEPALLEKPLVVKSIGEKWDVWSLTGGLGTFIDALVQANENNNVVCKLNSTVKSIEKKGKKLIVSTENDCFEADNVISCIPAYYLRDVVKDLNNELHLLLNSIPYVTVGIVNLVYSGQILNENSYGYLVPSFEPSPILGVIFDSSTFPQEDYTVLTVMMGGSWYHEQFASSTKDDILKIAIKEINKTLNISQDPDHYKVSIHNNSIPQYIVGHYEKVIEAKELIKSLQLPLSLAGNSYDGVGINDAIYSAKIAASSIST